MALGFSPLSSTPISALPAVGGDISGVVSVTLDDASLASAATVAIAATLAVTLDDATLSAAGTLDITASASVTLDDATLAATGALAITSDEGTTLDDATLLATGALAVSATLDVTLDDASLAATGTLPVSAALSVTLDDATLFADATVRLPQTGAYAPEETPRRKKRSKKDADRLLENAINKAMEPKRSIRLDPTPWLAEPVLPSQVLDVPEFNPEIAGLSDYVTQLQKQLAQRTFDLSQMDADDELLLLSL